MDNRAFWNQRYQSLPSLGSGPGSRGWVKGYKRSLVLEAIRRCGAASLADIGCGDLCWLDSEITSSVDYRGYDISEIILARNRSLHPAASFICHYIVQAPVQAADVVVCFDVLIHQNELSSFKAALANIGASATKLALVSYLTPPAQGSTAPAGPPPDAAPQWLEEEAIFQSSQRMLPASFPRGETSFFGALELQVLALFPHLKVREIGRHRMQSVYELTGFQ